MESVHGVDVSWLHHHAQKDNHTPQHPASKSRTRSPPPSAQKLSQARRLDSKPHDQANGTSYTPPATSLQTPSPVAKPSPKRPELLSRGSSDRLRAGQLASSEEVKQSTPKRPNWISSLSSKFSSQSNSTQIPGQPPVPHANGVKATPPSKSTPPTTPTKPSNNVPSVAGPNDGPEEREPILEPYVPQQPKSNSFLSSAFRRLSSGGPSGSDGSKPAVHGGVCPRQVLNVDSGRERCKIKELDQSKLRRVAFSVDVEVAGVSRYIEDQSDEPIDTSKKLKDKKLMGRSEGEALKNPKAVMEHKEKSSKAVGEQPPRKSVDEIAEAEKLAESKQKEVEDASQRLQEKQQRRQREPLPDNMLSSERDASINHTPPLPAPLIVPVGCTRPADKPTTDPLRIYRRCCQLREAPVLKRISEQLANIMQKNLDTRNIVPFLDLNGSRMQLPDLVCLGDWLAIVPVRKLLLDNANLTDEGLRVILSGLLVTKPPGFSRRKRGKSSPTRIRENSTKRSPGVIEKLSLRNNVKITAEGWKHLCVFLNLSHSLRGIDVSMIPFPNQPVAFHVDKHTMSTNGATSKPDADMADVLSAALAGRSGKSHLEELIMSECKLKTRHVGKLMEGVISSRLERVGLAKNRLDREALEYVGCYLQSGKCRGIDLGGNDISDNTDVLAASLEKDNPLWAISLADCNLDAESLSSLLTSLTPLQDLRFIDLSNNPALFDAQPNALGLLRTCLPQMQRLRRIHFAHVGLTPADAIGLAEVFPETRNLNHVTLVDNPELKKVATATDAALQEDACALYASLMVAVRVSKCLIAVEIESPGPESSEVVRALATQIDAYSLRNMERFTAVNGVSLADPNEAIPDLADATEVPDILMHLVGPEGASSNVDEDSFGQEDLGPDSDYLVGGTGVVKALSYCLREKSSDLRRISGHLSGTSTPTKSRIANSEEGRAKAKDMSKNLLNSARKIRARLRAAITREAGSTNEIVLCRLQFLDRTLEGIISRFESEFPECAVSTPPTPHTHMLSYPFRTSNIPIQPASTESEPIENPQILSSRNMPLSRLRSTSDTGNREPYGGPESPSSPVQIQPITISHMGELLRDDPQYSLGAVGEEDMSAPKVANLLGASPPRPATSPMGDYPQERRHSTSSIASRSQIDEEGRMLRLGQQIKRDVLPPIGLDDEQLNKVKGPHLAALRRRLEELRGDEIREKVVQKGLEATVREFSEEIENEYKRDIDVAER